MPVDLHRLYSTDDDGYLRFVRSVVDYVVEIRNRAVRERH